MWVFLALVVGGCAAARFETVGGAEPDSGYFAEFCAVSQIKKMSGFGAEIRGDIGGHSVFYLQGACVDPGAGYPVLRLCSAGGAGLSVNEHFKNAEWVATPGHDFFFEGGIGAGELVDRAAYGRVQEEARRLGIYEGVTFHDVVFDKMPAGWTREAWKYEMSVGTDYAIGMARGRYCARVPVDRAAMGKMIDFLNAENAPYRAGKVFHWDLFRDNCIHMAHNAMAAAGLWQRWETNRGWLVSVLDFPVPRNDFVNLMRRTNDEWPGDPGAAYDDEAARRSLLEFGVLPARAGALALSRPVLQPNSVYETEGLKLIFYDDPMFGPYQGWFDRIFSESRYTDPGANRAYFADLARQALGRRRPLADWLAQRRYGADAAVFSEVYRRYYGLMERLAPAGPNG